MLKLGCWDTLKSHDMNPRMANLRHELLTYRENKITYSFGQPFLATHTAYKLIALRF